MYQFSKHFIEQLQIRHIGLAEAMDVINNPEHVLQEDGLTVYQKLIHKNNEQYLLCIFVNEIKQLPVAVTGYITSKINKYLK